MSRRQDWIRDVVKDFVDVQLDGAPGGAPPLKNVPESIWSAMVIAIAIREAGQTIAEALREWGGYEQ